MSGFLGALVFLTRLPVRTERELRTGPSVPWFPVVGALIGAIVGGVAAVMEPWSSPSVAAAVAIVIGLLVTGCFHEDGLGDVADAFVGGWTREDRLRILKDSRHGTYGVVAITSSIVVRVLAVASLVSTGPRPAFAGCVVAHCLARTAAVGVMIGSRPATGDGLGHDYVRELHRSRLVIGMVLGAAIGFVASGWWTFVVLGLGVVLASGVARWSSRKVGGFTGDALGAVEQVVEASTLVALSILALHHPLWWG